MHALTCMPAVAGAHGECTYPARGVVNTRPESMTMASAQFNADPSHRPPESAPLSTDSRRQTDEDDLPRKTKILMGSAICIQAIVLQCKQTPFFYFCQTLISCSHLGNATVTDGQDWSGSTQCGDKVYVAVHAQSFNIWQMTVSALFGLLCNPVFGSLSDKWGRRNLLIAAAVGFLSNLICLSLAGVYAEYGDFPKMMVLLGAAINGATSVFGGAVVTMIIDHRIQRHEDFDGTDEELETSISTMVARFRLLQGLATGVGGVIASSIVFMALRSYTILWVGLCFPTAVFAVLVCFAPETLPKRPRRTSLLKQDSLSKLDVTLSGEVTMELDDENSRKKLCRCGRDRGGAFTAYRLIWESRVLTIIGVFVFFFTLGCSVVVVIQPYMITEFGWSNAEVQLAGGSSLFFGLASVGLAGRIIKKLGGPIRSLLVGSVMASCGLALMAAGPSSPLFFMAGLYMMISAAFATVAYVAFLGTRVAPSHMGAIQVAISALALMGFLIGSNIFNALNLSLRNEDRWQMFLYGGIEALVATCPIVYLVLLDAQAKAISGASEHSRLAGVGWGANTENYGPGISDENHYSQDD